MIKTKLLMHIEKLQYIIMAKPIRGRLLVGTMV